MIPIPWAETSVARWLEPPSFVEETLALSKDKESHIHRQVVTAIPQFLNAILGNTYGVSAVILDQLPCRRVRSQSL